MICLKASFPRAGTDHEAQRSKPHFIAPRTPSTLQQKREIFDHQHQIEARRPRYRLAPLAISQPPHSHAATMEPQPKRQKLNGSDETENITSALSPALDSSSTSTSHVKATSSISSPPSSTLPVKVLCPSGDLTLLVGKDPVHPFLVSRTVLTLASPVFRAMLTGNFSEATKKEIELEDDDARALLLVLQIAHLRFEEVARELMLTTLINVATTCDKYDMVAVCRPLIPGWVKKFTERDAGRLVFPSGAILWVYWAFGYESEFVVLADKLRMVATKDTVIKWKTTPPDFSGKF